MPSKTCNRCSKSWRELMIFAALVDLGCITSAHKCVDGTTDHDFVRREAGGEEGERGEADAL